MAHKPLLILLVFLLSGALRAQGPAHPVTPTSIPSVPKPLALNAKETLPKTLRPPNPLPPPEGSDSAPLKTSDEDDVPPMTIMRNLDSPSTLPLILSADSKEHKRGHYYWHSSDLWNFCHFRDRSGHHWYGWRTGGKFHWVLFYGEHFWWHDTTANRWLYYHQGYWWWAEAGQVQVYPIYGHYYLCDKQGWLLKDMGTGKSR